MEDVGRGQGPAQEGPGLPVRADDVDDGRGPEPAGPAEDRGQVRVEPSQQAGAAGVIDARPVPVEEGDDGGGLHGQVSPGIGVIAAVLAAGDEDEIERGRRGPGVDGLDPQAPGPQAADEEAAEQVAAGRADDPDPGARDAQADEIDRDVASVPAEGGPDRAEDELAGPGHALEAAGDEIDDGDAADEDQGRLRAYCIPASPPSASRFRRGVNFRPRAAVG